MHSLSEFHSKHTTDGSGGACGGALSGSLDCAFNPSCAGTLDVAADADLSSWSQLTLSLQPPAPKPLSRWHMRKWGSLTLIGCSDWAAHQFSGRNLASNALNEAVLSCSCGVWYKSHTGGGFLPGPAGHLEYSLYQRTAKHPPECALQA